MNSTKRQNIMHRWNVIQRELIPGMCEQGDILTPKLEKLIHTLEWVRIEEFTKESGCGVGRPPVECAWAGQCFCRQMGARPWHHQSADRATEH